MIEDAPNAALPGEFTTRQQWLEIALIVVVFFAAVGVPVPNVNETHYLTKAKHYWNPQWCAGDLFLESADAHLTFYWTVGLLTKWLSLPLVAWVGRFAAWLALAWAWQRLSTRVVPVRWLSIVTALLMVTLIEKTNFAGEWIVGGVEGKCFAYAFVFWALAELVVDRWQRVWPLLGLASAFHVLVGGWSVICAGAVWAMQPPATRPTFRQMLPPLLWGGVLALPGVVPGLLLTAGVPAEVRDTANQIYVFERLPHHLAIHRLPAQEIFTRFTRFGILLAMFAAAWRWNTLRPPSRTAAALWRIQVVALASIAICVIGLCWEQATRDHPALSASILKYYWYRMSDAAVPMAVALSLGAWVGSAATRKTRSATAVAVLATLIPASMLLLTTNQRWQELTPIESRATRQAVGWRDVCNWAREHTSPTALFMTPRGAMTFRWYAERPVFFNWKDIPQDAASQVAWWSRYQEVYFGAVDDLGNITSYSSLQALGPERLTDIARKHGIDYILTGEYPPLPLEVAYENAWYKIYDVRPPAFEE